MKLVVIVLTLVMTVFTARAPESLERPQGEIYAKAEFKETKLAEQNLLAAQERLAKQNQQLRNNPQHLLSHDIKKPVVAATSDWHVKSNPVAIIEGAPDNLREENLRLLEAKKQNKPDFNSTNVHKPQKPLSSTDMQKQIQKAEGVLVNIVELTNKLHNHEPYDKALPLAERQLKAVEEFEDKMNLINADEVKESGLPEKIAAVKELLKDTITHKNDQLAEQKAAEVKAQELLAVQEKKTKQLILQVTTYLSDPGVQKILNPSVYVKVSPSESVLNLELLGLRDFTLEDALAQLPVGSKEREQLLKVQQFETVAFKKLETEAPTFETVKNNILELIGFTEGGGFFRKQAEDKITFLKNEEIFNKLDPTSQEYVQEAIDQFNKSIDNVIKILTFPDTDNDNVASSLEKALQPKNPQAGLNYSYNQQNELYRLVRQLDDSNKVLYAIVSGISLPLDFPRDTYIELFETFKELLAKKKISDKNLLMQKNPSDKDIASAIEKVLSPQFAVEFLDSKESADKELGKKLAGRIGNEILNLNGLTDSHGYVLSEVDGQQVKIAFDVLVKELKIDSSTLLPLPENWKYISSGFINKVGEAWLRDFNKNNTTLSDVMKFKKEQILCEAWQIANGYNDSNRIKIFRQIAVELLTYPLSKISILKSLKLEKLEMQPFEDSQRVNATLLISNSPIINNFQKGLSFSDMLNLAIDEQKNNEKSNDEQGLKMNSVMTDFPKLIKNLSTFLAVKQGPARAGVGFLENMQAALFDPVRVTQLVKENRLPFVLKELTAFQQSVLQGKSVDDFSNEWWQVELYQRAEVFKNAIRILESDKTRDKTEAIKDFVSNISVVVGDYKEQLIKQRWQQRETLVLDQSETFKAQMKQWDTYDKSLKNKTNFDSNLIILREQQKSLEQFLEQAPLLLKQVTDVINNNNPKNPALKTLTAYKKQLETAQSKKEQEKYALYLESWNTILTDHPLVELTDSQPLLLRYKEKAQRLVDSLNQMNKSDVWKKLNDSRNTTATGHYEKIDEQKAILKGLNAAKVQIDVMLAKAPEFLQQAKEYLGILGRDDNNTVLVTQLKDASDTFITNLESARTLLKNKK